jgi:hypothetical protein
LQCRPGKTYEDISSELAGSLSGTFSPVVSAGVTGSFLVTGMERPGEFERADQLLAPNALGDAVCQTFGHLAP